MCDRIFCLSLPRHPSRRDASSARIIHRRAPNRRCRSHEQTADPNGGHAKNSRHEPISSEPPSFESICLPIIVFSFAAINEKRSATLGCLQILCYFSINSITPSTSFRWRLE